MKRLQLRDRELGSSLGLYVLPLAVFLLMCGCKSAGTSAPAGTNSSANPTLGQTRMNVNQAMTNYRNALAQGAITLAQQMQVDRAFQNFQQAFGAAIQAAQNNYQATTPANVQALANQVIGAISQSPFSDVTNLNNQ